MAKTSARRSTTTKAPDVTETIGSEVHSLRGEVDDLRTQYGQQAQTLASVVTKLDTLNGAVTNLAHNMNALREREEDAGKTKWNNIIGAGTLLVMILVPAIGAALAPIYISTQHNGLRIAEERTSRMLMAQTQTTNHGLALQLQKDIERLDGDVRSDGATIERNHEAALAAITAANDSLRREMQMLRDLGDEKLKHAEHIAEGLTARNSGQEDAIRRQGEKIAELTAHTEHTKEQLAEHTRDGHPFSVRAEIAEIKGSRFTARDGAQMREDIGTLKRAAEVSDKRQDVFDAEQRRRTERVYSAAEGDM
jgi:hypothetical protein